MKAPGEITKQSMEAHARLTAAEERLRLAEECLRLAEEKCEEHLEAVRAAKMELTECQRAFAATVSNMQVGN